MGGRRINFFGKGNVLLYGLYFVGFNFVVLFLEVILLVFVFIFYIVFEFGDLFY